MRWSRFLGKFLALAFVWIEVDDKRPTIETNRDQQ